MKFKYNNIIHIFLHDIFNSVYIKYTFLRNSKLFYNNYILYLLYNR